MCAQNFADRGGPSFMAGVAAAGAAYLFAMRELLAAPTFRKRVLVFGLVLTALWHIAFLRLPVGADDDVHRYVWDGRLQRLGYSPYLVVPSDPAVANLHTPETRSLNNPDLPSPYPAGAQLFFRVVTAVHESTFAFRMAFVLCEVAIVFLLFNLLRQTRRAEHLVLAFAWNPLLAIEMAGTGHIDIVVALLLVVSAIALVRHWKTAAAIAFGLAIAVKLLPIILLPLYWKRVRVRDVAIASIVVALLYVRFLDHGRLPFGSLGTYVQTFRFNGPIFATLARVVPPQLLTGIAVAVGWVTAVYLRRIRPEWSADSFAWPMAATLFFAPVVFPWYLLALMPFLMSFSTLLITIWTVTIGLTYVQWHLRAIGNPWGALPNWIMVVEYGLLAIAAVLMASRESTRRALFRHSGQIIQYRDPASAGPAASSMSTPVPFTEEERS
jgi:hypothetical protein